MLPASFNPDIETSIKIITSGNMVEIWEYENPVFRPSGPRQPRENVPEEEKVRKTRKNRTEAFQRVLRLAAANFVTWKTKFITLTFAENLTSVDDANKHFKKFIQRLRYKYGDDFRYIATIEFQKRGAVHYHILSDVGYIPKHELFKIWRHGRVDIEMVYDCKHAAVYVGKYMAKDIDDARLNGQKKYWTSRNMKKPVKRINGPACRYLFENEHRIVETYKDTEYQSEYCGTIRYRKYFLKD